MGTFFARLQRSYHDLVIGGRLDSNGDSVSLCMVGHCFLGTYKGTEELAFRESQAVDHHRMWREVGGGGYSWIM